MNEFPRTPRAHRRDYDASYFSRARRGSSHTVSAGSTSAGQVLTGALLAILLFVLWETFGLFIVTQRDTASRILARAVPALTQVDRILMLHGQELQQEAQTSPAAELSLANFPIHVSIPASQVKGHGTADIERLFVEKAGQKIYDEGAGAFAGPGVAASNTTGSLFSSAWTIHQALNLLRARTHSKVTALVLLVALLSAGIAALFCVQVGAYGRVVGLGSLMLGSALVAGLFATFCWLVVRSYSGSSNDPLAAVSWRMFSDTLSIVALVDGLCALTAAGLLFVGRALVAPSQRLRPYETRPDPVGPLPRIERSRSRFE